MVVAGVTPMFDAADTSAPPDDPDGPATFSGGFAEGSDMV